MSCCFSFRFGLIVAAVLLLPVGGFAHAEMASVYGGHDGLCGRRTANGERLNCSAMTAAHRTLPFGAHVRVCHKGCVIVRINDRGPWVRGRHTSTCRLRRRERLDYTRPGTSLCASACEYAEARCRRKVSTCGQFGRRQVFRVASAGRCIGYPAARGGARSCA